MPSPGEHRTVQARFLDYDEDIGWRIVSRDEAEHRCGFDPDVPSANSAKHRSLFFDDLLNAKVREFNPRYAGQGRTNNNRAIKTHKSGAILESRH